MRISDWSSDVCSSDLLCGAERADSGLGIGGARGEVGRQCPEPDLGGLVPADAGDRGVVAGRRAVRLAADRLRARALGRSEEHTSELQSLMRISYAVFCLKKKKQNHNYD